MKKNFWVALFGLIVIVTFIFGMTLFMVRQGDVVVLTTFGKPVRMLKDPGLNARWPWPVQKVHRFDGRVHCLEGSFEQTLTQDAKSVVVTLYAGWRIAEPTRFLERVGTMADAERNLNGLLSNYKNAVIGRYRFGQLVTTDMEKLRFTEAEAQILEAVQPEALDRYGIEVQMLGIRKISLPEAITEKVFDRMRAEREQIAERYRSEGEGEAIRIRAEADSQRDQILAGAEARAKRIRAEGDAEAAAFYRAFEKDPELAMFLRKLELLEQTLKEKSTVVLGSQTQPFDLLDGEKALPAAARRESTQETSHE